MSINDLSEKIKPFYTLLLLVVVACIFFALGRLSVLEESKSPIKVTYSNVSQTGAVMESLATSSNATAPQLNTNSGEVIGVKTSKKYYFPWCGTIKRVKLENQIHFASRTEAVTAGYIPGGNCKGLN